ncbi:hypothetical protein NUW58_g10754 [Xylaria curta]|uniref:Uncharacterized protein n=1 Tax=Xylaria curta TaxID=42375 RepID=A0ACC1MHH5_9PEZI|nr:hypothetical protein NUW58_g10754 [Xylaria curta]
MLAVSHDGGEQRAYLGVVQRHGETIDDAEQAQLQEYVRAAVQRLLGACDGPVPDRLDVLWMQERKPRGWGIRLLDRFDLPGESARAFDLAGCLMRAKYTTVELGKFVICCALVADCNKRSGQGHGR